ncbi:O-glucosyltransferase rumi homolog [Rhodamnia argentea]|uniref:O-glucosyltransferase rumi homolog n=1 Tax=Rhodamnia argentea TaxID=178133 RepID=A0A8B8PFL9_9MYRT|nr:O-glucosyltransferase rumi homolog [Rhodamnia argentea]
MEEEHSAECFGSTRARQPAKKTWGSATVLMLSIVFILSGFFVSWIDLSTLTGAFIFGTRTAESPGNSTRYVSYPLVCTNDTTLQTCPMNYPATHRTESLYTEGCPEYFRWIHEDLQPWKAAGITREMLENSKENAQFRLVILKGKAYLEKYKPAFQTRDVFTIWGILQLLRLYPGKVPDLELMFNCDDKPLILKQDYLGPKAGEAPLLFHYCGHNTTFDVPFPDWSFWGWPEVNIKPWDDILAAIKGKAELIKWKDREPYAFWKGNYGLAETRVDLFRCNDRSRTDWKARVYAQDWSREVADGFKHSNLEDQCTHRYKIYIEGIGWSVSEKYILACDSTTLLIKPEFYDYFMRGMIPMEHYWPIRPDNKCRDIKFAVEWGNNHTEEARRIGEGGTKFVEESLKLKFVYDYMFHLLSEYAKLLKFEVKVPPGVAELCSEAMACPADGLMRKFMVESMVKSPSDVLPCSLPPPYDPVEFKAFVDRKDSVTRQVEMWEAEYWKNLEKQL